MSADDVLRYAASLDQVSPHVLAAAVVRAARARELALVRCPTMSRRYRATASAESSTATASRSARRAGRPPGSASSWARSVRRRASLDGALTIFVDVDGAPVGALLLDDPIRPDAARTIRQLRRDGIRRIVMVTGDREENAQTVGAVIGVDDVFADRTPAEKVDAVRLEQRAGRTIMVGDGINDAPALALADVGVAVGARGATASSEAADVVLTVDRLDRLGEAVVIARRSRRIALESVVVGIGLSLAAMVVAAFGYLPPVWGARAPRGHRRRRHRQRAPGAPRHDLGEPAQRPMKRRSPSDSAPSTPTLRPDLARIRDVADALDATRPAESLAIVHDIHRFLVEDLAPHEEAEDHDLYPVLARVLGGNDPTATMSRAHVEIAHLIRRIGSVLDDTRPTGPDDDDIIELRRLLYGLHAILQLHFAQEDEGYLSLVDDPNVDPGQSRDEACARPIGSTSSRDRVSG